jgi:serine/threonine protein kinase
MNTIPRKLGRYVVIREIGRGAMGVVYKAHDPVIEREVAIKAIQISFDVAPDEKDVYLSRFYREAKAAGKLSHSNIVTIFDVDEDKESGTPFIVMEFLEGTTIAEVAASGILLPLEDINNMIIQLADALNYAHNEGVVHRDIKAANILVLSGMKVKIMDFGIARLPSSDLTQSGQFMGTPNYMSPEQIEGKTHVDGRSDLFSLGVIFYMLLTGERPFPGDSFNTVSYRIVHVQHVPPRTLNPNIPELYNAILTKLLAKDPADRYQTGSELVEDVKKLITNTVGIEELSEMDLDSTASGSGSPPPPVPENRGIRAPRELDAASDSLALSGIGSRRKMASLGLLILLVLALTFGSIYLIRSTSEGKHETATSPLVPNRPDPVAELSRQNAIRIKWDLAMKYVESGMLDKAIKELNDIVVLDAQNPDAKKFLDLVVEKKALEEKKKLEPPLPTPVQIVQTPKPVVQPKPKPKIEQVSPVTLQPVPEIKLASVDFEFEHGFPSGSFYIFTNDKLAFEGSLSGEKKKILIFRNYKGKLTGSLQLPVGQTNVLVHVVCREKSVSASKRIKVNVQENGQHNLRIKYLKSPKQLELTWT